MDNQHSITTVWTCECGTVNTVSNRCCTKCNRSMPDAVVKAIYEEEILLHKGIVLSTFSDFFRNELKSFNDIDIKGIYLLIFACLAIVGTSRVIFLISRLLGILSMVLFWIYAYESSNDMRVSGIKVQKKYINISFAFSMAAFVMLWVTSKGMQDRILSVCRALLNGWVSTTIVILIISVLLPSADDTKRKDLRKAALTSVGKIICLAIILRWLS